jgi:hypothetical protein
MARSRPLSVFGPLSAPSKRKKEVDHSFLYFQTQASRIFHIEFWGRMLEYIQNSKYILKNIILLIYIS